MDQTSRLLRPVKRKRCGECEKNRLLKFFAVRNKRTGLLQSMCRNCRSSYDRTRHGANKKTGEYRNRRAAIYARNKGFIKNYLLAHPCVDCGEADPIVLEFDHVRGEKSAAVSTGALRRSWSIVRIEEEIAKCEVRCANCHRRVTYTRRITTGCGSVS